MRVGRGRRRAAAEVEHAEHAEADQEGRAAGQRRGGRHLPTCCEARDPNRIRQRARLRELCDRARAAAARVRKVHVAPSEPVSRVLSAATRQIREACGRGARGSGGTYAGHSSQRLTRIDRARGREQPEDGAVRLDVRWFSGAPLLAAWRRSGPSGAAEARKTRERQREARRGESCGSRCDLHGGGRRRGRGAAGCFERTADREVRGALADPRPVRLAIGGRFPRCQVVDGRVPAVRQAVHESAGDLRKARHGVFFGCSDGVGIPRDYYPAFIHEVWVRGHFSGRPNRTKMHVGKVES